MKKLLIGIILLAGLSARAQQFPYFTTVDSLKNYINGHIRNDARNAFTNLRLNTALQGIAQFLDSARLAWGGGGGGGAADGNNFSSSLNLNTGVLTLGRTGLSTLSTNIITTHVTEGTNLYFTTPRARSSIGQGLFWNYNTSTGIGSVDTAGLFSLLKDTLTGKLGVNAAIPSTNRLNIEYKGAAFSAVSSLRSYTGTIDANYLFKINDGAGIREYRYDATDASSSDDGVLCIVNGSKRLKLVYEKELNIRWFGADPSVADNTAAINAAATAASTAKSKTILVSNGTYIITGNVTIPTGVIIKFVDAKITAPSAQSITGGIIDAAMRTQILNTNVTIFPEAVLGGKFSMRWYGAVGDGSDEVVLLQKCFDVCTYANKIKNIYWPSGTYTISKGLLFDRDDNADGVRDFPTGYIIEGESKAFGGSGETIISCSNGNSFGINFQQVKGLVVRNLMAFGQNEELAALSLTAIMDNPSTDWTNGNRTNSHSPHVAFSVDGIGTTGTAGGDKYPDFTAKYTEVFAGGSTDVTFEHCGARYWVVGFGNNLNGTIQNGDKITYSYCWSDNNKYAFANGSSQNRTNKITQCGIWGHTYIAFDSKTFGDNIGDPQEVDHTNIAGYVRYLCRLNNFFNKGLTITDSHFELLKSLGGNFEEDAGRLLIERTFINLSGDQLPGDGSCMHHATTIFRGAELTIKNSPLTYYQTSNGPMAFCATYALFDNVQFDVLPFNTQGVGQTDFRHCKALEFPFGDGEQITLVAPSTAPNQRTLFTTDMEYIVPWKAYSGDLYGSVTRKKINRSVSGAFDLGFKDAQSLYLGSFAISNIQDPDNGVGYSHAEFTLSTSSDEYKMLQVGDHLLARVTDEFGRTSVYAQFGDVVSKNGGTGVVVLKNIPYGTTATSVQFFLYRPHELITPLVIGNVSSGVASITSVIIEGDATTLPTGVAITSPYFPEGTYLVSYNSGTGVITTSNPASATKTAIDVVSSDWHTIAYGYLPNPVSVKLGFKRGDIIYNTRADLDTSTLFWMCTKSGIFGTAVLPTFRPFFKQQPPQLVDNTTADAYGLTYYYNITSSVHRFKNGATWYDIPISNIYSADGTLAGNRSIAGSANSLSLGTGGSNLSSLTVNATGDLVINSGIKVSYPAYSSDADFLMSANAPSLLLDDASITANRTITLPTGSTGSELEISNKGNNGTFFYQFSPTPTDNTTGSTVTNIGHRTSYKLKKDAGGWRIVFKY